MWPFWLNFTSKFEPLAVNLAALVKFGDQIYRIGFCKSNLI